MAYKAAWYASPINLPEKVIGKFSIQHRVITGETPIIGARQALLRGLTPVSAALKNPLRIHELHEEGLGLWMTDLPEELNQIAEMLQTVKPRGHVLIGGHGLGIVAKALLSRLGVSSVTVVERSWEVISLCRAPGYTVFCSDIVKAIQESDRCFDYYLLDTWCGTSETTWWTEVLPLRRIIRQRWGRKPKIHCWAEDIMWGQVGQALLRPNARHWRHKYLPTVMSAAEVTRFQTDAGLPTWEKRYAEKLDKANR
jgi:hypothetical protein